MGESWLERLLNKAEENTPVVAHETRARAGIDITDVQPHGSDLLKVYATIDGEPRKAYVPRETVTGVRESQRRRHLAHYLRQHFDAEAELRERTLRLQLLGREDRV